VKMMGIIVIDNESKEVDARAIPTAC
jgi:hypothetical protein